MSTDRQAARSLHQDVEAVWERLRAEFVLQEGFWLAFLFSAQAPDIAELVARTRDQAGTQAKHAATLTLTEQAGEAVVLRQLLTQHPAELAATWVLDDVAVAADRVRLWSRLLRLLNERRDALAAAHPAALLLVCPAGSLPQVRDTAPDLWAVRSLTATLDTATHTTAPTFNTPSAPSADRTEFTPSRQELREWTAAVNPFSPLDPGNPKETRYVPLTDAGRAAVDTMMATIELATDTTTQLLSGPNGSGKTTELYRLKCNLERAGFHTAILDIGAYVHESSPIDVTDFLIALALGAHDVLGTPETKRGPGFVSRLRRFLERLKISIEVPGLSTTMSREGLEVEMMGASVDVELQRELRSSNSVVSELRSKLTYHIGRLYEEVAAFLATLLPSDDSGGRSVLIVDGLDGLGGTTVENDRAVQASIQELFVAHANKLKFGSHHLIYTVPTYLQLIAHGELPYDSQVTVPVPRVRPRPNKPADTVATTIMELHEVISRRLPVERIFADTEQLNTIIKASGGHLRDLLCLLRQVLNLMYRMSLTPPLRADHIEEAIGGVAYGYTAMTAEREGFLRRVVAENGTVRPKESEVQLMATLLRTHMLLGHLNGQDWYEVHPLARRVLGLP